MKPQSHGCPVGIFSSNPKSEESDLEQHMLTSYWTRKGEVGHEAEAVNSSATDQTDKSFPTSFMRSLNEQLLSLYIEFSKDDRLTLEEIVIKSSGFFQQETKETLPVIRIIYRTILDASGTAAALSHLHNKVKQETIQAFRPKAVLQINSQLLVR